MDSELTKDLYEKLLINYMFTDEDVRAKLLPYLDPKVFMYQKNSQIVKNVQNFLEKYNEFPKVTELKIFIKSSETYEHLVDILNIDKTDFGKEFILEELEEFYRKSLYANLLVESQENISKDTNTLQDTPDKFREALAFTFDTNIGLSILDDAERKYKALHNKDKVISTGLRTIDELIEGGSHEKSLNLFMAACVTKDTKVNIKYIDNDSFEHILITKISNVKELLKDYKVQVDSPDGWVDVLEYVEKGKKELYKLTANGKSFRGSSKHLVETEFGWMFMEDIKENTLVLTIDGMFPASIEKLDEKEDVVDIVVGHENHRYYTENISSHNTNVGKSLCLCSLATNFLLNNKNVLYLSLEMSEEKISERIDANLMDININDLKLLDEKTYMKKSAMIRKHIKGNFHVIQYGAKSVNSNRIRSILKELKVKKNFTPDVLIVDYLGLMGTNNKSKDANSYTEMKVVSEELRAVCVELGISGWSAVQTNRSGMNNVDLDITNIADSVGTAATADLIIGITQTDELKAAGRYKFSIIKNRYGINGQYRLVGVNYPRMRVFDLDEDDDDNPKPAPQINKGKIVDDMAVQALQSLRTTSTNKKKDVMGLE